MHSRLAVFANINTACLCFLIWYSIYTTDENSAYFATSDSEKLIAHNGVDKWSMK